MRTDAGWTLRELFVVIVILALLAVILVPATGRARELARLVACGAAMHDIDLAMRSYSTLHRGYLPPFAFSDIQEMNLPLSGHWGGASQPADPAAFGRLGVECVNLWVLVRDGLVPPGELICPAGGSEPAVARVSYFPYTFRYSTYCLRMPASEDLFRDAPLTWERYQMGIYALAAGGQRSPVKISNPFGAIAPEQVPRVRFDRRYRIVSQAACGDGDYDALSDAMLSDAFWLQEHSATAPDVPGLQSFTVKSAWCHGETFNVLKGDGSVRAVHDDGTVRANTIPPGGKLADDGAQFGTHAERVWQFFDGAR